MLVVRLPGQREDDTYSQVFRFPYSLLRRCRAVCNEQLEPHQITTDLEQRIFPKFTQLVLSPEGHRVCLGNWNSSQLEELSTVLLSSDSSDAITAVLLNVSRLLVKRVDTL